jgi:hypothetical protein
LDHNDELWEGVLHINPASHGRHHRISQRLAELLGPPATAAGLVPAIGSFNLGEPEDYRVGGPLIEQSGLIDLGPGELAERIDWP